jgi:hypothetical protein
MATTTDAEKPQVFLEPDDEIRGQKFVCLSFLTPNSTLVRDKAMFFFSEFLKHYAVNYKIKATESFIFGQLRDIQNALSEVSMDLSNADTLDASGRRALAERVDKARETISRKSTADLEAHVKANMSDFKETTINEEFATFMSVHDQRLEDEFHKANSFRTTVHGLKVRGVYSTHEQAVARAKALHKKDPYFHVFVADVGEWLPWDPNPDHVADAEYSNDELNKLMKKYRENQAEKDAFFEEVKRQKLADAAAATKAAKEVLAAKKAAAEAKPVFGGADVPDGAPIDGSGPSAESVLPDGEDLVLARKREAISHA